MLYRQHEDERGPSSHLQLVVPREAREETLQDIHGGAVGGHLGEKIWLKERFYWPGQSEEVKRWCQNCPSCARKKTVAPKNGAPLQTMKASYSMKTVVVDIVGPFPETDRGLVCVGSSRLLHVVGGSLCNPQSGTVCATVSAETPETSRPTHYLKPGTCSLKEGAV